MNVSLNNTGRVNAYKKNDNNKKSNALSSNKGVNEQLKSLMKQKEGLQKQIKDIQKNAAQSKLNSAENGTKVDGGKDIAGEQIKEIQKQIEEVNKQIAQVKADAISKAVEDGKLKQHEESKHEDDIDKKFINFSTNMKDIKVQKSVKKKLINSARILETEIKLDQSRRAPNTSKKEKLLAQMKKTIEKIDDHITKDLEHAGKTQKPVKTDKTNKADKTDKVSNKKHDVKNVKETVETLKNMIKNDNNLTGNLVDARV